MDFIKDFKGTFEEAIEYYSENWEEIKLITNIKFLDGEDLILSNDPVYIPIASDTMIEHRINIREVGTNG